MWYVGMDTPIADMAGTTPNRMMNSMPDRLTLILLLGNVPVETTDDSTPRFVST